jgi:ABC-2 type transport system permease protein
LAILGLTIVWTIMGVMINFLVQILFGTLGFWSPESWGPKFLFYVIVDATAGKLFPLNIFPKIIQDVLFLTPFPYLSYVQTQLFLDKLSSIEVLKISGGMIFWTVLLCIIVIKVWHYGIKNYSASGQ